MIVVEFAIAWCKQCKEVIPVIKKLASKHKSIKSIEIDADIEGVGKEYLINGVQSIIFFHAGIEVNRINVSSHSKVGDIEKSIKHNCSLPYMPDLDKATNDSLQAKILCDDRR